VSEPQRFSIVGAGHGHVGERFVVMGAGRGYADEWVVVVAQGAGTWVSGSLSSWRGARTRGLESQLATQQPCAKRRR